MRRTIKALAIIIAATTISVAASACAKKEEPTTTVAPPTSNVTTSKNQTEPQSKTEVTTKITNTETKTTKKHSPVNSEKLTVKQALDKLELHYIDCEVSGTVSEGEYYHFAVYKNNEKYASVKVNMSNGDAVETLTESGEKSEFNVFA